MTLRETTIDKITSVILTVRARQLREVNSGQVKVNLGSGLQVAPGWINIDGSLNALIAALPNVVKRVAYRFTDTRTQISLHDYLQRLNENRFIHHDLRFGIPLANATVDYLYSSHFLEHLYLEEARRLLRECHRVLKPNGVMRLVVPDLDYAIRNWNDSNHAEFFRFFFTAEPVSAFSRHKWMYTFDLLSAELHKAGFAEVNRCRYQQGAVPDLQILDNRPDESLYVEALAGPSESPT